MIRTLIALPYEIARLPLVAVDSTLSRRLPDDAAARLTLDRTIGSADKLAGALLGSRSIATRGADRLERSEKLATAARLEVEAAVRRDQASKTAAAGRQQATRTRTAAQKRAASGLEEADVAEARGKQRATTAAKKTAAARKASADKKAASRSSAVQQRKKAATSASTATKKAAQREARSELDQARETKAAAAGARADAERLSDLAEAKRQERKDS